MRTTSEEPEAAVEYKLGRGIDYLGSIARMLRDLSGFATLVYELLQNADDAPGATEASFDITPEALIVWNDGNFSDCGKQEVHPDECPWLQDVGERCDFHRFRSVSAGDKGRRADLTGAFGIGFTAVYQITDQPEIISSGQHWIIDETQPEEERIRVHRRCPVCEGETGTRFVLPWARDPDSEFRRRTNAPSVDDSDRAELARVLDAVVPTAMLFLRKIRQVALLTDSKVHKELLREDDGEDTLISDGTTDQLWRVISGDFADEAEDLRARYPGKLEKTSDVAVAVPHGVDLEGLLCAYLPTEERTGLPFHVNADFFPASDRKRLVVEGYQGEWNRAAVAQAAQVLAERLLDLREVCQARQLWSLLVDAHQAAASPTARSRDLGLEAFWDALEPELRAAPILLSSEAEWIAPERAFIVRDPEEEAAAQILASLGGAFAHPDLREFCFRLPYDRVLGLSQLRISDFVDLLQANGLNERIEVEALPIPLQTAGARDLLLLELDGLIGRAPEESRRLSDVIGQVALAPGADGALWPWAQTFRADHRTRSLFEPFESDAIFLDENQIPRDTVRLGALARAFEARDAISWLASHEEDVIVELLEAGGTEVAELLGWFERHKEEFVDDPILVQQLTQLPLFPSRVGLQPLVNLALPGDFVDELGLADIVDVERVGDAVLLLRRLGAQALTFLSYVTDFVPRSVDVSVSDPERWWRLILLLAEKLGHIEDDPRARDVLVDIPCVRTADGGFALPSAVYFESALLSKILVDYPKAVLPSAQPRSVEAFYRWVGVETRPRPGDLLERVRHITEDSPTLAAIRVVADVIDYLARELVSKRRHEWGALSQLTHMKWLPARGDVAEWHEPQVMYTTFQEYLFSTQAMFLDFPAPIQRSAAAFLEEVGVRSTPSTEQMVSHLLHCSEAGVPVNQEVYAVLNQREDESEIDRLRGKRWILLPSGSYVTAEYVFWGGHPFGRFRASLGADFQRFAPLLSRLGVREHPTFEDASAVLSEMAAEFGSTNTPIDDQEDVRVYMACWRMLDVALEEEEAGSQWFDRFRNKKVIRDSRGVLVVPERIFFEDVPGLAERFPPELGSYLIRRPEGAWRAMRTAGVRDLSGAVSTRILELGEREPDEGLQALIRRRIRQIGRVLDPFDPTWPAHIGEAIESLDVASTSRLVVEYALEAFGMTTQPAELEALFVPEDRVLFVSRHGAESLLSIARELARAIAPDTSPGSLAANLSLVLSAADEEAADRLLDEAWVPRLEHSVEGTAIESVVEGFGGEAAPATHDYRTAETSDQGGSEDSTVGVDAEEPVGDVLVGGGESSRPGGDEAGTTTSGDGRQTTPGESREDGQRSRLRSYVIPAGSEVPDSQDGGESHADDEVDRAGVDKVVTFELASGRNPVEKPHAFPGYDIESYGEDRTIERYIEVKSLSGSWDSYGVSVSPRQISEARRLGDSYWLYVVARARRADFSIYCIRNPAMKIDQFMFDDAWIGVGETSVGGRIIPPVRLIESGSRVPDRSYLPFYDIPSQEPASPGGESGWVEWGAGFPPGSYLVQVLGDALKPMASRGSVVVIEPVRAEEVRPGDRVLLDLGGQTDPATGTDLAFRVWPEGSSGGGDSQILEAINPDVPALPVEEFQLVRVLGRIRTEDASVT